MESNLTQTEAANGNVVVTHVRAAKPRCSCPALLKKHRRKLPGQSRQSITKDKRGRKHKMAVKKTELYRSLWASCDALRGGMDASQYKDYVLTLLFMKYVTDKYKGQKYADIKVFDKAHDTNRMFF